MKIVIITPFYNYNGGVEIVTKQLEEILIEEGHEVTWLTLDGYVKTKSDKLLTKFFSNAYLTSKLYRDKLKEFDLVICNGEFGFRIHHPNCINVFHGSYFGFSKYLKSQINFRAKIQFNFFGKIQKYSSRGKYVITVSKFIESILKNQGIKVDKVISNSVDIDKFKPLGIEKNNKYLFVGGYNYYGKGFDILLELTKKGIEIDCVTDSAPPYPLKWIKGVNNDEMPIIYNQYNALIFPSRFEACSMVTLEALACGLPVFISEVGIGLELLDTIPDFVIKGWGESSIEEYITKINLVEKDYIQYSEQAREYVLKNHAYSIFKTMWREIIQEFNI